MDKIWEKCKKFYKSIEEKIIQWVEENEKELDFLGSYVLGCNAGYLWKWSDEWYFSNSSLVRAFNKYYESEPLRLTDNSSGANSKQDDKLVRVRTSLVWSYDDEDDKYYPFIPEMDGSVLLTREWNIKKRFKLF